MKTFLGFTTGFMGGAFAGMLFMAGMLLEFESLRDFVDTVANGTDYT